MNKESESIATVPSNPTWIAVSRATTETNTPQKVVTYLLSDVVSRERISAVVRKVATSSG